MIVSSVVGFVLTVACLPTWWLIAQKEHYLPGSASLFGRRWLTLDPTSRWHGVGVVVVAIALVVSADSLAVVGSVALSVVLGVLCATWPVPVVRGLPGRAIRWTARMRRLGLLSVVLALLVCAVLSLVHRGGLTPVAAPILVDLAAWLARPIEARFARPFVDRARRKLADIDPLVVAITGSFGKTSTKRLVAHLVEGTLPVAYSPASFNNLMGLCRTVDEVLQPGDRVLVAEMGTYGTGEIAEMTRTFPPALSCITSIGDMHLERMGTRAVIARAKSEIVAGSHTVVLCVDYPELEELARAELARGERTVVRVSGHADGPDADLRVVVSEDDPRRAQVLLEGAPARDVELTVGTRPGNAACAVAIARALGVPDDDVDARLATAPDVEHRASSHLNAAGITIVDDSFNSNPSGARAALAAARDLRASDAHRVVVITPGMVELGPRQDDENAQFAEEVVDSGAELLIVKRTNRRPLMRGSRDTGAWYPNLQDALKAANKRTTSGDVVLIENDLPAYYP